MKNLPAAIALIACAITANTASASTITYDVNRTIGDGTITGFIETDGTLGTLGIANITDWTFTLTAPNLLGGSPDTIDFSTQIQTYIIGTAFSATSTELLFDFDYVGEAFVIFQGGGGLNNFWCIDVNASCIVKGGDAEYIGFDTTGTLAQTEFRSGLVTIAAVSPVPVPAAAWLFGSGLIGLIAVARRKA